MRFRRLTAWLQQCISPVVAALTLALTIGAGNVGAEPQWGLAANPSQAQIDIVLAKLASMPSLESSEIDHILMRLHFSPGVPAATWAALSARDKLDIAHRWAHAVSEENGVTFIDSVARDLATRYDSIRFDPFFHAVFHGIAAGGPHSPPMFRRPAGDAATPLPPKVVQMLDTIAEYIDGPGPLSRVTLAKHRFDLDGPRLEQALGQHKPKDFLAAATRLAPKPPPVHERLNLLMQDVMYYAESAGHDRRIEGVAAGLHALFGPPPQHAAPMAHAGSISQADSISPYPYDTPGNLASGGAGGSPERAAPAAPDHAKFDTRFSANSRKFEAVRRSGLGRGGVIAGAPVTSTLGQPKSIRIMLTPSTSCGANGQLAKGRIELMTSGASYTYSNISCDILYAAARIVYQSPGSAAWTPGDAIGLATIDTAWLHPTFPLFIPADGNALGIGTRKRMLLHPALNDTDIGRAIGLLDLWPVARQKLALAAGKDHAVERWLASLEDASTWKWSDAPARIVAHGNTLAVVPLHGKTLLAMRTFSPADIQRESLAQPKIAEKIKSEWRDCEAGGDSAGEHCQTVAAAFAMVFDSAGEVKPYISGKESTTLTAAAPTLVARIQDFARTEEFLRALAVFRWARQEGAKLEGVDVPMLAPRPKTPETIVVGLLADFIAGAPASHEWEVECKVVLKRFETLAADKGKMTDRRREFVTDRVQNLLMEMNILIPVDGIWMANCAPPPVEHR